ncbi:hypothetical protein ACPA54_06390 [Uniformispora flossi]|uniref:hypothetical protein n=1 Tax=Uniformispora flossi TaxID=3390723 RepID=UPI003C2BF4D1
MANSPRTERWSDLERPMTRNFTMPGFDAFYTRWLAWANGTPKPVVHRGARHAGTGGVTESGTNPWVSADLVPGDTIRIDGGKPTSYLAAVDAPIRTTVDLLNRHVGATVASCAGHENDDRAKPSKVRFFRLVAGTEWDADKVTRAMTEIAGNTRLTGNAPAVDMQVTRGVVEDGHGTPLPIVNVHFHPTTLGEDAYYAQLPWATEALNTSIREYATGRGVPAAVAAGIAPASRPGVVRGTAVPGLVAPLAAAAHGLDAVKSDAVLGISPNTRIAAPTGRPTATTVHPSVAKGLEKVR